IMVNMVNSHIIMKKIMTVTCSMLGLGVILITLQSHVKANVLTYNRDSGQKGKAIYEQTCLPCHQADAGGVPGMNPPLQKSIYVQGPPARLIGIVLKGLNDGVEIDGETYSNPMPPFSTVLKDQEIADVLSYLRSHFGNKAAPISLSQVTKIRQSLKK
ncbi:MAG TPA: cytochrome c, partial [Puia sp.]|nr:cytochrome c [Puia sp.]